MQWNFKVTSGVKKFLLIGFFALPFIPYIILCFYAHPVADDLTYTTPVPVWHFEKFLYMRLNGRYTSNMLVLLCPVITSNSLVIYRLVALILFILITASLIYLLFSAFGKAIRAINIIIMGMIISIAILNLLPCLPQGIYWFSGSMTYVLGCVFAMFYAGTVFRYINKTFIINPTIHLSLILLLLVISIGFNEVQMLLFMCIHIFIWLGLKKQERFHSFWFIILLVCISFSSIMFFSPGNRYRGYYYQDSHHFFHSLFMTALQLPRFFFAWISYAPLLMASMLFAPVSLVLSKRSVLFRKAGNYNPYVLFFLLWVILFLCIFPAYWSTGILGQHRTLNTACFFFIPAWFLFLHSLFQSNNLAEKITFILSSPVKTALTLILAATLLFSGNCGSVLMDLVTGKITGFNKEMNNRYILINEALKHGQSEVTLPPLENKPASLFVIDIHPGCNFLANREYALFYKLKKVCCDSTLNTTGK